MKIGILTLPPGNNYGGILQAFALQYFLYKNGYKPTLIYRRENPKSSLYYLKLKIKYNIHRVLGNKRNWALSEEERKSQESILCENTIKFIDKYIPFKTEEFSSSDGFKTIGQFDAYIVGSDQVWRPKYTSNIYDYFFDFIKDKDVKRISYAASFGTDVWEFTPKQTIKCSQLIKLFDAVSVREDKAVDICRKYLNVSATHVLDPTLLLDKEEYIKTLKLSTIKNNNNSLMTYVLDKTKESQIIIDEFAINKGLVPFSINLENLDNEGNIIPTPPVELWLESFIKAEFIITDSFHGTVFSIIFNKPFIAIGNIHRGLSRFESLLKLFNIENRLVTNINQINKLKINDIDWDSVNTIREKLKKESVLFIKDALQSGK